MAACCAEEGPFVACAKGLKAGKKVKLDLFVLIGFTIVKSNL